MMMAQMSMEIERKEGGEGAVDKSMFNRES